MRRQSRQVVGVMIHVMAPAGLGGAAVTSSVMGDDAIAFLEEEQHLRVPIIGRERPAMAEHDGLTFSPVLIIDVDVSSVFFSDSYAWHCSILFCWLALTESSSARPLSLWVSLPKSSGRYSAVRSPSHSPRRALLVRLVLCLMTSRRRSIIPAS